MSTFIFSIDISGLVSVYDFPAHILPRIRTSDGLSLEFNVCGDCEVRNSGTSIVFEWHELNEELEYDRFIVVVAKLPEESYELTRDGDLYRLELKTG